MLFILSFGVRVETPYKKWNYNSRSVSMVIMLKKGQKRKAQCTIREEK